MQKWLSDNGASIGFLGFLVGVLAVVIAIWQIRKSMGAKEAAEIAGRDAMARMRNGFLLILLPQLTRIRADLDKAVRSQDYEQVASLLLEWPWFSGQLWGLLDEESDVDSQIRNSILDSNALASETRLGMETAGASLPSNLQSVQLGIAVVTDVLGLLSMNYTKGK